ncbi:hypothetical protein [Lentibacillus sp. Marseille-P4043]|uniref:hypothetical protein n=1 Tax=Lentibacillus sp. Marseille-P4043 TaxID=2040293 RepID=UPI000D0B01ED|nr:hypothetical protein [Lentibacillus sp. Marseille-P4043]
MKNKLSFINRQGGFILPYVLFIVAIVLLVLTTKVNMYKNDIHIANNHIEQLEIETLLQMGRAKFVDEFSLETAKETGKKTYTFPPGIVKITYTRINEMEYQLLFQISTEGKSYSNVSTLLLPNSNKTDIESLTE